MTWYCTCTLVPALHSIVPSPVHRARALTHFNLRAVVRAEGGGSSPPPRPTLRIAKAPSHSGPAIPLVGTPIPGRARGASPQTRTATQARLPMCRRLISRHCTGYPVRSSSFLAQNTARLHKLFVRRVRLNTTRANAYQSRERERD